MSKGPRREPLRLKIIQTPFYEPRHENFRGTAFRNDFAQTFCQTHLYNSLEFSSMSRLFEFIKILFFGVL